jgi:hypothetical protein
MNAPPCIVHAPQQVLIYKWVPIIGPILGSAFVIGLYIAARLLRGDLTDRMKMMDEGEEKRRRTALKEARIAFLEEEIPALVARKTDIAVIKWVSWCSRGCCAGVAAKAVAQAAVLDVLQTSCVEPTFCCLV